ncbi:MAG: enoyl-CoA hydratase-related protein [Acidobacteria bacterium]|nr:enoyl-CoA hydratase-related protein [Acidobacteriota bacterium]MCI0620821.1 enoyl-CoA hydratase-related protein [Acidobacteriota bacterium]MCI0721020.1 enoyl-CoA hydratase-related protein [Acidobacteriota bacterium]
MNTIRVSHEERWAWVILNRPARRNALNTEILNELRQALTELETSAEVRVLIITGEGKAFCSGLDLEELRQMHRKSFEESLVDSRRYADLLKQIYLYPKPVVAALNGPAIAGGCGLASVCDLTLAAVSARLGYTEAKIGFVAAIVSYFLVRRAGERAARDLLFTARLVDAQEACRMGLVNEVVEDSQLLSRAREVARQLSGNSSQSIQASKALLARIASPDLDEALDYACQLNARSRSSTDCIEGVAAFLEKRPPKWQ